MAAPGGLPYSGRVSEFVRGRQHEFPHPVAVHLVVLE